MQITDPHISTPISWTTVFRRVKDDSDGNPRFYVKGTRSHLFAYDGDFRTHKVLNKIFTYFEGENGKPSWDRSDSPMNVAEYSYNGFLPDEEDDLFLDEDDVLVEKVEDDSIPLNSPPACPRDNGAMEKGLQQLKGSLARILPAPAQWDVAKAQPFIRTALDRQNLTQRPRLQGRCAWSAYQQMERTRWPRRLRHEIFEWIKRHAECRISQMEKNDQQVFASAWRWAALTWLRCQGLVVVSQNKCVTPFFDPIYS